VDPDQDNGRTRQIENLGFLVENLCFIWSGSGTFPLIVRLKLPPQDVEDRELEAGELESLMAEAETPLHQLCGHLTPIWVPVDSYRLKQEQLLAAAHQQKEQQQKEQQQKEQQQKEQQEKELPPVFLQVMFLLLMMRIQDIHPDPTSRFYSEPFFIWETTKEMRKVVFKNRDSSQLTKIPFLTPKNGCYALGEYPIG
jgi:hypothetical protein